MKMAPKEGVEKSLIADLGLWGLISSIVGARVLYILYNLDWYIAHPLEAVFSQSGLAFHGGLGAAIVVGILFLRKRGASVFKVADICAPSIAVGEAIGRVGCFLYGCCYGKPTSLLIGVKFPLDSPAGIYSMEHLGSNQALHPTQLYSSIAALAIFGILTFTRSRKKVDGQLFLLYLILLSASRFVLEWFRADSPEVLPSLTVPQIFSLVIGGVAISWLILRLQK
jgi:phosphatidylglycerol:prolipoprotein diacylglycerol transferase